MALTHISFKDAVTGVDSDTLQRIAAKLGTSETTAVHIAINRLYYQLFSETGLDYPTAGQLNEVNALYGEHTDPTTASNSLRDLL